MISKPLSEALDRIQPKPSNEELLPAFCSVRDKLIELVPSQDGRITFDEYRIRTSSDPEVVDLYADLLNKLNDLVEGNYKLVLQVMRRKHLVGDDTFASLTLALRRTLLNFDPSKGKLSTIYFACVRFPRLDPPLFRPSLPITEIAYEQSFQERDLDKMLSSLLAEPELTAVRMLMDGCELPEIARAIRLSVSEIQAQINKAMSKLRDCPELVDLLVG